MVEGNLQSKMQGVKERLDEKKEVEIAVDEGHMMEVKEHRWEKDRLGRIAPRRGDWDESCCSDSSSTGDQC